MTFRSRTLYQPSYNGLTLPPIARGADSVTFRSRTLYQLSYNGLTLPPIALGADSVTFRSRTLYQLSYNGRTAKTNGGQGRIRTSVARKERQIYSLLPLTTRPPVRLATRSRQTANGNAGKGPQRPQHSRTRRRKNQYSKGSRVCEDLGAEPAIIVLYAKTPCGSLLVPLQKGQDGRPDSGPQRRFLCHGGI